MGLNHKWAGRYEPVADKVEDTCVHAIVGTLIVCAAPLMLGAIAVSALADAIRGDDRKPHCPNDGL